MSKNNNVNPGQYKVAGRERPGQDISPELNREARSVRAHESREQARKSQKKKRSRTADR
jgi:hypothetical protein